MIYALACGAQTAEPVAAAPAATAVADTNAPPPPPKDPAKCVVARFGFDGSLQPDAAGTVMSVMFKRSSASYLDCAPVNENSPRFVAGRSGKALLVESAYANHFSISQSGAAEAEAFKPLPGTTLSISADKPWQGKEALAVATKGEGGEEGFSVEALVDRAFYTKENSCIMPVVYLASLYLKGQGNLKLMLKDVESGATGAPVYVDLPADWQRFSCVFAYPFSRKNIGAGHEADWKKSLPADTNITSHLQLVCATVDGQKLNFFADGFQLEQRNAEAGGKAALSPHTWVLGAFQAAQEQLTIDVRNDYFNSWKKTGSIAFWFYPLWEARDDSAEMILQVTTNQLCLSHSGRKLHFSPAGVSFGSSDWKNSWHHVVVTWNEAGERMLYIDGMDYPNAAGAVMPMNSPDSIAAGDFAKNLSPNGALDELILYNIALNADQAKALASAEPAVKPAESKPPEPVPAPAAPVVTAAPAVPKTDSTQAPAKAEKDPDAEDE